MDDIGWEREGMEKAFESHLRGEEGTQIVELNSEGRWSARPGRPTPRPESPWPPKLRNNAVTTTDPAPSGRRWSSPWLPCKPDLRHGRGCGRRVIDMKGGGKATASHPTFDISQVYKDSSPTTSCSRTPASPHNRATMDSYPRLHL